MGVSSCREEKRVFVSSGAEGVRYGDPPKDQAKKGGEKAELFLYEVLGLLCNTGVSGSV